MNAEQNSRSSRPAKPKKRVGSIIKLVGPGSSKIVVLVKH